MFSLQKNDKVSLVVARKTGDGPPIRNLDEIECSSESSTPAAASGQVTNGHGGGAPTMRNGGGSHGSHSSSLTISHTRSRSEPAINHKNKRRGRGRGAGAGGAAGDEDDEEEEDDYSESEEESEEDDERVHARYAPCFQDNHRLPALCCSVTYENTRHKSVT